MEEELRKMKVRESGDIVFQIKNMKSRFYEGKEYVPIRKFEGDKIIGYQLRESLTFAYKD